MNKLIFPLMLGLILTACQNTPKNASESTTEAPAVPAAPAAASQEDMQQASANLSTGIKMLEELRTKADALPAKIRKEKASEIAVIYANIEGMTEKQAGMLSEIKAASTPTASSASQEAGITGTLTDAQLKDYNEAAAQYAKEAQAMQESLDKMADPTKKN